MTSEHTLVSTGIVCAEIARRSQVMQVSQVGLVVCDAVLIVEADSPGEF